MKFYSNYLFKIYLILLTLLGLVFIYVANVNMLNSYFKSNLKINSSKGYKYNILFVETNHYRERLGIRQLCAVESAAKHNSNARVQVKVLKARIDVPELFEMYPNIKWEVLDLDDVFRRTPLFEWWKSNKLANHDNYTRFAHLADALRLTLVYKNGGIYSDLDTITIKSFEPLTNYSGFGGNRDNPKSVISNGFFHFRKNHEFLLKALEEIPKIYNPKVWGTIGPLLIRPLVKKYCNVTTFIDLMHLGVQLPEMYNEKMNATSSIQLPKAHPCDVTIFPYYICYPFQMSDMGLVFRHNASLQVYRTLHSYSLHFFGRLSSKAKINWNENSIYEFFATTNCPITQNLLRKNSNIKKLI